MQSGVVQQQAWAASPFGQYAGGANGRQHHPEASPPHGGGGLSRMDSAMDMRQLSNALVEAREGTGEVRSILLKASFRPRLPGLTKIVSKLSKEGCWRKALEVYESVDEMGLQPDTALTNAAISACDRGGRWQKALELFERMERLGLPRDAITYSATISSLAKGKQWHAALQVFDHMQASNVEADVVACCSLINALERGGQWQLAEKLFLQMCTVQTDGQPAAPMFSANGKLMRAHSSPTSVLDSLRPASEGGPLMPIGEETSTPRHLPPAGCDGQIASLGILQAAAQASPPCTPPTRQLSGGLALESIFGVGPPATGVAGEELAAALNKRLSLGPPGPGSPLDRQPSAEPPNPFSIASKLVAGLRQTPSGTSFDQAGTNSAGGLQRTGTLPSDSSQLSFQPTEGAAGAGGLEGARSGPLLRSPTPGGAGGEAAAGAAPTSPQVAAAHHLHRAMTVACCNDLDMAAGGQPAGAGAGLASMFNFSHAARVAPNRVCCNALLAAYARAKPPQWQRALHLLRAMWDGGPTLCPDTVSYNTVLKACANGFQLGKAIEVYKEMVRRGVRPNVTSYNCLIAAASDAGNYPVLQEIGEWMDVADMEVRASCINAFVSGLVKVGRWDEAVARFQAMLSPSSPVRPTASTFNTIMTGYMKLGQYAKVCEVFDDMLASGLPPSIVSYNTLLSAYASTGAWSEALDTLCRVLAAQLEGVSPNTTTFNTVLAAMAKGVGSEPPHRFPYLASRALQVYQQMQGGGGSTPDVTTYTTLIRILSTLQHPQQVLALHDVMLSQGHTPDAPTATAVLNAAAQLGQVQKAVCLAHSMAMQGVPVDPGLHAVLLSACLAVGAWDQAVMLCTAAQAAQGTCPATAATFNSVLNAALAAGQFGIVVELLQHMQACGLEVDTSVASMVLGGSQPSTPATPVATPFAPSWPSGGGSTSGFFSPPAGSPAPFGSPAPPAAVAAAAAAASALPAMASAFEGRPPAAPPPQLSSSLPRGLPASPPQPAARGLFPSPLSSPSTPAPAPPPETFAGAFSPAPASGGFGAGSGSPFPGPGAAFGTSSSGVFGGGGGARDGSPSPPSFSPFAPSFTPGASSPASASLAPAAPAPPAQATAPAVGSLEDAHSVLIQLSEAGDVAGALEVLERMKLAGIKPDKAVYTALLELAVRCQRPHLAVQLCCEAHDAGALHHYALPDLAHGPTLPGAALGNVVDLRDCAVEVGATVLLTWLARVVQLQPLGLVVQDRAVRIITGQPRPAAPAAGEEADAPQPDQGPAAQAARRLSEQLQHMLTTGDSPAPAFQGLVPLTLPDTAVSLKDDGCIVEVQTPALYRALPKAA